MSYFEIAALLLIGLGVLLGLGCLNTLVQIRDALVVIRNRMPPPPR